MSLLESISGNLQLLSHWLDQCNAATSGHQDIRAESALHTIRLCEEGGVHGGQAECHPHGHFSRSSCMALRGLYLAAISLSRLEHLREPHVAQIGEYRSANLLCSPFQMFLWPLCSQREELTTLPGVGCAW